MAAYITSFGVISPYDAASERRAADLCREHDTILRCVEPDYKQLIPPVHLRRMSRILKLGLGAAKICLNKTGNIEPDAILVGTGLACINDLELFMRSMLEHDGQEMSPIPFINSSHNTVAAQISRLLQNHSYNNTYCHRGSSFESALTDALMMINGQEAAQILLGGIDEFSMHYYTLINRINGKRITGEGATFFLLSPEATGSVAEVTAVKTFYQPAGDVVHSFLSENHLSIHDIDTIFVGSNGNEQDDSVYDGLMRELPPETRVAAYKHLCGEYTTSGGFALALAAQALQDGYLPKSCIIRQGTQRPPERVLIFNHYLRQNYSLMLLGKR
ncbi:MAG: beta-ketoacyl synthase chain length factor [Bacteroidales bacterium]|jgi:3-oxoacyl-(acyl-carrier-protein) synthase|nr:beta-ketoacyl synthase chain length factor [Bacteroidales bacterium]